MFCMFLPFCNLVPVKSIAARHPNFSRENSGECSQLQTL
jgi:hypothetical protein